jgi:TatD DNase family protein
MVAPLFDTHTHLNDERFQADLTAVLDRAKNAGVEGMLCIGIDLPTSRAVLELAGQYPMLKAVVGIQPNYVAELGTTDWDEIAALATAPNVVGIGESGLDRYWDRAPFPLQEDYFSRHLQLAHRLNKPIIIHCREAELDVVRMLKAHYEQTGPIRGVMHSFCGDQPTATECLNLGLHLSFAGMLTYKTAENLRVVAATVPEDRLLVETDCPYLAPVPHRGKRNEPAFVRQTAECLATVRGVSVDVIAAQTTQNARRLFNL